MFTSLPSPVSLLHQFGILQSTNWSLNSCPPLTHKTAVITGGTSGIGCEITKQLLLHDIAHIIILSRSQSRFTSALTTTWEPTGRSSRVRFLHCDLTDLASVERAGADLAATLPRLDMLFLNAALPLTPTHALSPQGVEAVFAANHLGHFLLTLHLLPVLTRTPQEHEDARSARIVVASSSMHMLVRSLPLDSLTSAAPVGGPAVVDSVYCYARSKLANILFAKALARRLDERVYANAYFPGNVPTEGMDAWKGVAGPFGGVVKGVFRWVGQSVVDAAATGVFLGCAEEVEKGGYRGEYWVPVADIEACSALAQDERLQEELWKWSEGVVERWREGMKVGVGAKVEEDGMAHVHLARPTCLTPVPMV